MRRFSATNSLTAATMLVGTASALAAATGQPRAQGVALGAAVVFGSLLVRYVARDSSRARQRQDTLLDNASQKLDKVSRQLAAEKRKLDRRIEMLDKRIQRESSTMTLRILSDLNAARLEQVDAMHQTGENNR